MGVDLVEERFGTIAVKKGFVTKEQVLDAIIICLPPFLFSIQKNIWFSIFNKHSRMF